MYKVFMFVNVDWFFYSHRLPIAEAARERNFDLIVYTEFTQTQESGQRDGYRIFRSPMRRTASSVFKGIQEVVKTFLTIQKHKPDLIHAVTIKPILVLGLIARITRTPFVGAVSGLGPVFAMNNWKEKIRFLLVVRLLKIIFKNPKSKIICQSKGDRNVLITNGVTSSENISLIFGSGVDLEVYKPTPRQPADEKYVLMSSRILKDKGVVEYCKAARLVQNALGSEVKFRLSGPIDAESPTHISMSEIETLTCECGVEFLGDRKDMPDLLSAAQLFVFPSYYAEGVPKVLLEAAASGTAIITTDHSGCRDVVLDGETGILVAKKNVTQLAEAMITLLENTEVAQRMGRLGREVAEANFSDMNVVDSHYHLYQSLLT